MITESPSFILNYLESPEFKRFLTSGRITINSTEYIRGEKLLKLGLERPGRLWFPAESGDLCIVFGPHNLPVASRGRLFAENLPSSGILGAYTDNHIEVLSQISSDLDRHSTTFIISGPNEGPIEINYAYGELDYIFCFTSQHLNQSLSQKFYRRSELQGIRIWRIDENTFDLQDKDKTGSEVWMRFLLGQEKSDQLENHNLRIEKKGDIYTLYTKKGNEQKLTAEFVYKIDPTVWERLIYSPEVETRYWRDFAHLLPIRILRQSQLFPDLAS